jgi:hypothetical protein
MNVTIDKSNRKSASPKGPRRWKLGLLPAVALAFISSLPQIYVCFVRGSEWNGSCAYLDTDELPYVAYTNALIDGRPRRNDPYTGNDNRQFETLFSIQSLPAYAVALPAKALHVSADTAFIVLLPLVTAAAVLAVWWLLLDVTGKKSLATVGAICVLSLGTAAAHSPLQILQGIVTGYDFFPFLRRYVPALPFPLLLASSLFVWRALTRNPAWAVLAGFSFVLLVYSYFFLWTAAAAWFCILIILWLIGRPEDRKRVWQVVGIFMTIGAAALAPYSLMLMQRANTIDTTQLLEVTHAPDLLRAPELYGILILGGLAYHARRSLGVLRDPKILFAASFALAPFLVFNQQVLTGRSLQPFHYEEFVANYWVVLSAIIALGILRRDLSKRVIIYLAAGGLGTAVLLGIIATRMTRSSNIRFDEVRAVALKLRQENRAGLIFASDFRLTNSIPTVSRNPVLWSRYLYTFSNVDSVEQKKRYFQYLYYRGFDENHLARALHTDFFARWEIFGPGRANPMLTGHHDPITEDEISNAIREYAAFTKSFDSAVAENPLLSYAVVSSNDNLSNLDRWYQRDEVARTGEFITYRLTLRLPNN